MKASFSSLLALAAALPWATAYTLTDNIVGNGFYNSFDWQAISDPTHGYVKYVDQGTSQAQNLTYASSNSFILRADYKNIAGAPGRSSVRIRSKKTWTNHVAIFDTKHMPQGCGTWPAIWETKESNWPNGGEVDILEGVNDQAPNAATLHTVAGCSMPASRSQTGTSGQLDCNWQVNGNTGCGVRLPTTNSYGPSFNSNGGGWYAMERTPNYIRVWFWPRNAGNVPAEVKNGAGSFGSTAGWGTPVADFPNTNCNIPQFFQEHNIIINLTFCGDWAGSVYGQSGCPSSCVDYVTNNPGAFSNAYFEFNAIRVYT